MTRRRRAGLSLAALGVSLAVAVDAHALSASDAQEMAEEAVVTIERDLPTVLKEFERVRGSLLTIEKRIARGELLKETGDHEAAIRELSKVLELYRQDKAPVEANADALFLIAETYFDDEQYLSASRHYREIVDSGASKPYTPYAGRALGRLVDVALRTGRPEGLDWVFERMATLPEADRTGALQYARAKAYFARGDLDAALASSSSVSAVSPFAHQAAYLRGVVAMKRAQMAGSDDPARFEAAVVEFRRVTQLPAETDSQKHVVDLAWMAIGRLQYESERSFEAVEAYSHVDRKSEEFSDTLFELGWVYARMGDYQRAQRALEILSISSPDALRFADGPLLQADLQLRAREFDRALELYESVRAEYDPIKTEVEAFLAGHADPGEYYDHLVRHELERGKDTISPVVVDWLRYEASGDGVFSIIDDVTRSNRLIRESRQLAKKLNVALGSMTRVKAFPEVKAALVRAVGLLNKIARVHRALAAGADDVDGGRYAGELGQVRARRRELMGRVGKLPVSLGDFADRETASQRRWNVVGQKVQGLSLEADRLQALANGLRRVLDDAASFPGAQSQATQQRIRAEIAQHDQELAVYLDLIKRYREGVDIGRLQVGFGDSTFAEDEQVRAEFSALVARELSLLAAGAGGEDAAEYARDLEAVVARTGQAQGYLEEVRGQMEGDVAQHAALLSTQVAIEARNIEDYAGQLQGLESEARVLVGEVAMMNFRRVRERIKGIVLRADTGIFQQAWELREAQRERVRQLQRERSREERELTQELREVIDDAGGAP